MRRFLVLQGPGLVYHHVDAVWWYGASVGFVARLHIGAARRNRVRGWINPDDVVEVISITPEPDCDEPWWYGYPNERVLLDAIVNLVRNRGA